MKYFFVISALPFFFSSCQNDIKKDNEGSYELRIEYHNVDGLTTGSPVLDRGLKIGKVKEMDIVSGGKTIEVIIELDNKYKIPKGSEFTIFSSDILGTRAINVELSDEKTFLSPDDRIIGKNQLSLGQKVEMELKPFKNYINDSTNYSILENNDSVIIIKFRKNEAFKARMGILSDIDTLVHGLSNVLSKSRINKK